MAIVHLDLWSRWTKKKLSNKNVYIYPSWSPGLVGSVLITWVHPWFLVGISTLRDHLGSPLVFGGVCVDHLFSFLCCVFCFVCLHPVSVYCDLNHDIVYALLNKHHTKIKGLSWSWSYDAINAYQHFSCELKTRSWRGVLDTTLCDPVCQGLAAALWLSQCTPVSFSKKNWPPRYNWNIFESGIKHHNFNP